MVSPSGSLIAPLTANKDSKSLEVKPDEEFNSWATFVYCSAESTRPVAHGFTMISSQRKESEEIQQQLTLSWVEAVHPSGCLGHVRNVLHSGLNAGEVGEHTRSSLPFFAEDTQSLTCCANDSQVAAPSFQRGTEESTSWPPEDITKLTEPLLRYQ